MEPIVEVRNVTKEYGEGDVAVHALRGVDLTLMPGEFSAMAGPSGSGKSTLLNLIGCLDHPTSGRIVIDGQDVAELSSSDLSELRRDRIGFVFQNFNLVPVMTAMENAEYVLMLQGLSKAKRRERVSEVLEIVGLGGLEDRFPRQLSGGQQQRVAIARAVAARPALILADEPTANVDSENAQGLLDLMEGLNRDHGVTFLFSTHDRAVRERARRLLIMKDGLISTEQSV